MFDRCRKSSRGQRSAKGSKNARLAMMRRFLGPVGSDVAIVPHSDTPTGTGSDGNEDYLATRQLSLAEGLFDLHYRGNPRLLRELMVRSAERHLVLGLVALVSLVVGTERILRRNLVNPLRKLSHQLNRMRDGGGWLPCLPETDTELAGLSQAIVDLGPGLERQIYEWIGAERRSAVALVLNDMENRVREPRQHALSLIEELQACETLSREQAMKFRRLRADLHDIHEALTIGEKTFP